MHGGLTETRARKGKKKKRQNILRTLTLSISHLGAPTRATARKELGGGHAPPDPTPGPSASSLASSLRFAAADTVMDDLARRCRPLPERHAKSARKNVPTCPARGGGCIKATKTSVSKRGFEFHGSANRMGVLCSSTIYRESAKQHTGTYIRTHKTQNGMGLSGLIVSQPGSCRRFLRSAAS